MKFISIRLNLLIPTVSPSTEKDPPSPPQFRISNVNVHSATISWMTVPGGEEVTGYQIFIRGNDFETHEMVKSVLNSTMPTNHTINSLKCGS